MTDSIDNIDEVLDDDFALIFIGRMNKMGETLDEAKRDLDAKIEALESLKAGFDGFDLKNMVPASWSLATQSLHRLTSNVLALR